MPTQIILDKIQGNYTSDEFDLSGYVDCAVQVWSESTSSGVVNLEMRTNANGSGWFDLNAATTNPTATGTIWSIPTVLCESDLPCSCPALLDGLSLVSA